MAIRIVPGRQNQGMTDFNVSLPTQEQARIRFLRRRVKNVHSLPALPQARPASDPTLTRTFSSAIEMDRAVAEMIVAQIKTKGGQPFVFGAVAGNTPRGVYEELVRLLALEKEQGHNLLTNLVIVGLEEYHAPNDAHVGTVNKRDLESILIDKLANIGFVRLNFYCLDGTCSDPRNEAQRYEDELARLGGIDLQLLGIGRNGIIGLNQPDSEADSKTRLVELRPDTRFEHSRFFFGRTEAVPERALTMGIETILRAKAIILMASGDSKAQAIGQLLSGAPRESLPASLLRYHPGLTVAFDQTLALGFRGQHWLSKAGAERTRLSQIAFRDRTAQSIAVCSVARPINATEVARRAASLGVSQVIVVSRESLLEPNEVTSLQEEMRKAGINLAFGAVELQLPYGELLIPARIYYDYEIYPLLEKVVNKLITKGEKPGIFEVIGAIKELGCLISLGDLSGLMTEASVPQHLKDLISNLAGRELLDGLEIPADVSGPLARRLAGILSQCNYEKGGGSAKRIFPDLNIRQNGELSEVSADRAEVIQRRLAWPLFLEATELFEHAAYADAASKLAQVLRLAPAMGEASALLDQSLRKIGKAVVTEIHPTAADNYLSHLLRSYAGNPREEEKMQLLDEIGRLEHPQARSFLLAIVDDALTGSRMDREGPSVAILAHTLEIFGQAKDRSIMAKIKMLENYYEEQKLPIPIRLRQAIDQVYGIMLMESDRGVEELTGQVKSRLGIAHREPQVHIFPDYTAISTAAAQLMFNRTYASLSERQRFTLGLATGSSPIETYQRLVTMFGDAPVDLSKLQTFNLDEYFGLRDDHPESYRRFMDENLFGPLARLDFNFDLGNTRVLNGIARDPLAECERFEDEIDAAGGIGFQLLGIGSNGHIAFSEPWSSATGRTTVVNLTYGTRRDNARLFLEPEEKASYGQLSGIPIEKMDAKQRETFLRILERVPYQALSMGIGTIMEANEILLVANGQGKAQAIAEALEGPISEACPASLLRLHPSVHFYLDQAAAGKLLSTKTGNH